MQIKKQETKSEANTALWCEGFTKSWKEKPWGMYETLSMVHSFCFKGLETRADLEPAGEWRIKVIISGFSLQHLDLLWRRETMSVKIRNLDIVNLVIISHEDGFNLKFDLNKI